MENDYDCLGLETFGNRQGLYRIGTGVWLSFPSGKFWRFRDERSSELGPFHATNTYQIPWFLYLCCCFPTKLFSRKFFHLASAIKTMPLKSVDCFPCYQEKGEGAAVLTDLYFVLNCPHSANTQVNHLLSKLSLIKNYTSIQTSNSPTKHKIHNYTSTPKSFTPSNEIKMSQPTRLRQFWNRPAPTFPLRTAMKVKGISLIGVGVYVLAQERTGELVRGRKLNLGLY